MLLFEFDGPLFQFDAREPQIAPLPQLPPKITDPHFPDQPLPFMPLIQVPSILPTSAIRTNAV
jgi:hypothetical protein